MINSIGIIPNIDLTNINPNIYEYIPWKFNVYEIISDSDNYLNDLKV